MFFFFFIKVSADIPIDLLSSSKARQILDRIDLLNKIREEILSHPHLEERLCLCKPSGDTPDWWQSGKHDKELLLGAAKHGLGRTDVTILNDPDFSFHKMLRKNIFGDSQVNKNLNKIEKAIKIENREDILKFDKDEILVKLEKGEGTLKIEKVGIKKDNVQIDKKSDVGKSQIELTIVKAEANKIEEKQITAGGLTITTVTTKAVTPEKESKPLEVDEIKEEQKPTEESKVDEKMEENTEEKDETKVIEEISEVTTNKDDESKEDECKEEKDDDSKEIDKKEEEEKSDVKESESKEMEIVEETKDEIEKIPESPQVEEKTNKDDEKMEVVEEKEGEEEEEKKEDEKKVEIEKEDDKIETADESKVEEETKEKQVSESEADVKDTDKTKSSGIEDEEKKEEEEKVEEKIEPDVNNDEVKEKDKCEEKESESLPEKEDEKTNEPKIEEEKEKIVETKQEQEKVTEPSKEIEKIVEPSKEKLSISKIEDKCSMQAAELKAMFPDLEVIQPLSRLPQIDTFVLRDKGIDYNNEPTVAQLLSHNYPSTIKWPKEHAIEARLMHIVHAIEHKEWPVSINFTAGDEIEIEKEQSEIITITTDHGIPRPIATGLHTNLNSNITISNVSNNMPPTSIGNNISITSVSSNNNSSASKKRKRHIAIDVETDRGT